MATSQQAKLGAVLAFGIALLLGHCYATEGAKRKIIIILGAPCAGCGTQSPNIVNALPIPHLDTGNMLREAAKSGTPAGLIAGRMMKEGVLVTDEIVNKVVEDRIAQPDCAKGFLLDGYPRNVAQSKELDRILAKTGESVTDVLVLRVPMEGLKQCVMHRWTSDSGDEWTSDYLPFRMPKSLKDAPAGTKAQCQPDDLKNCNMWDDWTGEPLYRRADDNLETLAERVKIYEAQTYPVLDHYTSQNVIRNVDAYQSLNKVWADIEKALGLPPIAGLLAKPPMPLRSIALSEELETCTTKACLDEWRDEQEKKIKEYVPKAYQQQPLSQIDKAYDKKLSTIPRKIVVILGPPCAGCGTQSPSIINAAGIPHLDTGNMLREASKSGTPAGLIAGKMMKEGVLVTDDIVNKVVADRIAQPDCKYGFLLDGYPRNAAQSVQLDNILAKTNESVSDVLSLNVPIEGLQQCVTHRWTADGGDEWTSDYIAFRVPKSLKDAPSGTKAQCQPDDLKHCNMWDDWTGEPLYRRADDNLQTLAERVKLYYAVTTPVLDHYKSQGVIRDIDGYQAEPKVWADIANALHLPVSKGLSAKPIQIERVNIQVPTVAFVSAGLVAMAIAVVVSRKRSSEMMQPPLLG